MTKKREKIILVDDNNTNLTAYKNILKPFYEVYPAPSAAKMLKLMENVIPDLILLDVEMPDMNGYEAASMLKNNAAFCNIPIIFLSARDDPVSEKFGLNLGALDYIHKPIVSSVLLSKIENYFSPKENKVDSEK
jgi:putative two-component system response regulator